MGLRKGSTPLREDQEGTCAACGRIRASYLLEHRVAQGTELVVCVNATECLNWIRGHEFLVES